MIERLKEQNINLKNYNTNFTNQEILDCQKNLPTSDQEAEKKCLIEKKAGQLFDSIFEELSTSKDENKSEKEKIEDNCFKKYIIEKNLLDVNEYKIELKNISNNTKCDEIIQNNLRSYEEKYKKNLRSVNVPEKKIKCILEEYHNFNDEILAITYISSLSKITDEQKQREKQKFIDILVNVTYKIQTEC